jgi:internalin A
MFRSQAVMFSTPIRCAVLIVLFTGCNADKPPAEVAAPSAASTIPTAPALDDPAAARWERLHEQLRVLNPEYQSEQTGFQADGREIAMAEFNAAGLKDISPLADLPLKFLSLKGCPVSELSAIRGMPLNELALEETQVTDLSPVAGMALHTLWLNGAPVADLKPLAGLPLTNLHLLGTKVRDISPLRGMPLESLWLNEMEVLDLSPLEDCPLVSLTLHKTPVKDISVVRRIPTLQRLHIGETEVTDLRPLDGLRLTRLIVSPGKITEGLDVIRQMDTLQELDVELREPRRWSPEEFWRRYDAGDLR